MENGVKEKAYMALYARVREAITGRINRIGGPCLYVVVFVAFFDHRAVLSDFHDCRLSMCCNFIESLSGLLFRERLRLGLVCEHDVDIVLHDVVQECLVRLHHIV